MKRNEIAAIGTRVLWTRHSEAPSETRNEKYMIFECDYNYSGSATIAIFAIVYRHLITKATPGKFINRRPISVGIGETIVFAFTNYTQCLTKYICNNTNISVYPLSVVQRWMLREMLASFNGRNNRLDTKLAIDDAWHISVSRLPNTTKGVKTFWAYQNKFSRLGRY